MTDLRKAAEMALEAFEDIKKYVTDDGAMPENWDAYHEKEYYALEALRQALAQFEQEPVAWISDSPTKGNGKQLRFTKADALELSSNITPLYTAPPSKPWIGLTDDEIAQVVGSPIDEVYVNDFRKVEAKLKEKNT